MRKCLKPLGLEGSNNSELKHMASLLVIGGSGFFGKSILDSYKRGLLASWDIDKIFIMARKAEVLKSSNPDLLDNSVQLINGDISTCLELPFADYVIHAAASTDAANYLAHPDAEKKNIQSGTYNYCELAKKYHCDSRIVYCSSGAIYGQQPANLYCLPEEYDGGNIGDMHITKRDYAAAKRDAENAIQKLGLSGRSVSIARCFAFVGKYLPRDQHFAIGNFIHNGINKKSIEVKSSELVYRSYMYSDDLVNWLMTIAHAANHTCPIFNVGSSNDILIDDLAFEVAKIFGVKVEIINKHKKLIDRYIPCTLKAFEKLNLRCEWSTIEAIKSTILAIKNEKIN